MLAWAATACAAKDQPDMNVHEVFASPAVAELASAVARGDSTQVKTLAPRTGVAARGDQDVTLLQWAVLNRSNAGLLALLEAGADPSQPGTGGATVVHLAAMADDPTYLRTLLANGADPNVAHAATGATPLMSAVLGEREPQFRQLMAARADLARTDQHGNTVLHVAAKANDSARLLDLLRAGADARALNHQGVSFQRYLALTPSRVLNEVSRQRRAEIVHWLTTHGIEVDRDLR
jgi:ankyrin repeat protein